MIYDSLDIIPYKVFLKIVETDNVLLLAKNPNAIESDEITLRAIWEKLHEEHLNNDPNPESKKIFRLSKSIAVFEAQHTAVLMACESLKFDWNDDLVQMLHNYGYTLRSTTTETYYSDIERIERETSALVIKADQLKKMLPKYDDKGKAKGGIDSVMASYSAILGFDFDYNEVTYTKFYGLQGQVNAKIKALELQNVKNKKHGK